ncbi:HU family DNA-binding protein [Lacrimispora indolis]|uniref:HU family DNA-binding protein n=1 Tax=Lacrimispora indolis TaxID=69825 RepID=UPI0004628223|nr:HU family DNA-binding protein [[Clostridium] methoxybenzovorans]
MNKTDVLKMVAESTELSQKDVDAVLAAYANLVKETLTSDKTEKVTLPGLGTFSVKHVGERSGVAALAGGKAWTKPEHDELKFKISSSVKEI